MVNHQYFTRSKAKSNYSSKELSILSSSTGQLRDSFSMASSFTKVEDSSQSHDDHTFTSDLHAHQPHTQNASNISPSHSSSKQTPIQFSQSTDQILQDEVNRLKAELQLLKCSSSLVDPIKPSTLPPNISCTTTVSPQSSITTSTVPSIQYVINVDPLQQMKDFVKPFFGSHEDDALKWLVSIEHFFDIIRLPGNKDHLCFQYAPAFLKTFAYRWWSENKSSIDDWSCFKQMLIKQFGERNEYRLEQQINQRKQQHNEPVIKYYYDMLDLCYKCDPTMSDKQKVRKLILGLRLSLYQEAIKDDYSTPSEFLIKVQQLENIEKLLQLRQISIDESMIQQQRSDSSRITKVSTK